MPDRFRENFKRKHGGRREPYLERGISITNNTPLGSQLHL
jgi:hypothetical protein